MDNSAVVVGGGIGGLACALGLGRSGVPVTVLERAPHFAEVGAGVQLGPNAVRVLADWGLAEPLRAVASYPDDLRVHDGRDGRLLARLTLGASMLQRFGQPYACVHRADLHQLLLQAVSAHTTTVLRTGATLAGFESKPDRVQVALEGLPSLVTPALIGCDGLWSRVRDGLLGPTPPQATGHLAYRALMPAASLAASQRINTVQVWWGTRWHVVAYPVRAGAWLNLVAVVRAGPAPGQTSDQLRQWTQATDAGELHRAIGPASADLLALLAAAPSWTRWVLHDRPAMRAAVEHAQGRVALLGDAAHPMRPYLAQGASMALEDAWTLQQLAAGTAAQRDWEALFARYARARWQRNARVQRAATRNGRIYHLGGLGRAGRDLGLRWLGERVMRQDWLYSGPPHPTLRA